MTVELVAEVSKCLRAVSSVESCADVKHVQASGRGIVVFEINFHKAEGISLCVSLGLLIFRENLPLVSNADEAHVMEKKKGGKYVVV